MDVDGVVPMVDKIVREVKAVATSVFTALIAIEGAVIGVSTAVADALPGPFGERAKAVGLAVVGSLVAARAFIGRYFKPVIAPPEQRGV